MRTSGDAASSGPSPDPPSILSKAFDVLRAFNSQERVMTLSELARAAQLPKSTVHRLLGRLIELDAIENHRGGYKLSLSLLQLGATTPAAAMRDLAMPYLAGLHRWSNETVHFAVLRGFDVVYLEKVGCPTSPSTVSSVGARLPANCTAIGKALLAWENLDDLAHFLPSPMPQLTQRSISDVDLLIAELRRIKGLGVARERGETRPGLACVAAPVVVQGFAVGALSIGFTDESDKVLSPQVEKALRESAAQISCDVRDGLKDGRRAHWFPGPVV